MSVVEQAPAPSIDLRNAVSIAKRYLGEISDEPLTNLRLEEVERDRKEGVWRITLGYDTAAPAGPGPQNSLGALLRDTSQRRAYKVVSLTNDSGEFISVKLRLL